MARKPWLLLLSPQTKVASPVVLTDSERPSQLDTGQTGPRDALEGLSHTLASVRRLKSCGADFDQWETGGMREHAGKVFFFLLPLDCFQNTEVSYSLFEEFLKNWQSSVFVFEAMASLT